MTEDTFRPPPGQLLHPNLSFKTNRDQDQGSGGRL